MTSVVRMRPSVIGVNPRGTACCSVSVICWKRVYGHRLSGNPFERLELDWALAARSRSSQRQRGHVSRRNPLNFLAPRPGLEPGTYGLTDPSGTPPGAL